MIHSSLYVGTNANATGKRLVALGMMELAAQRFSRVAFFRPVVRVSADEDMSIQMMRSRYGIDTPAEDMAGVTRAEARQMLADEGYSILIQHIQQRFKSLESKADFVIVEGTSFQGLAPELEFELNADIAVNLGCRVLSVYGMGGRAVDECIQAVMIGNDSFADHGAELVATVINQVPEDQCAPLLAAGRRAKMDSTLPLFLLPEEPCLRQATVREIQTGIGARLVAGDPASLNREVSVRKVAAMQLPSFLERLSDSALVITPGDRSDILLGCVLACSQPGVPSPSAVVLTGGILPPLSVRRLVEAANVVPVLVCAEDTFTVASKAAQVRAEIGEHSPGKIESAISLFENHIDPQLMADRLQVPAVQRVTPMLFEHSLLQQARKQRTRIVLPEATEPRILQAVDALQRRHVADLVLLGDPAAIAAAAQRAGVTLGGDSLAGDTLSGNGIEIIDPAKSNLKEQFASEYFALRQHKGVTIDIAQERMLDVTYFGTMMVHLGLAGGLVSGAVHTTANTIRPAFEFIKTKPGVSVVSSVFLMCLKDGVLVYGDCAVIPNPTAEQLTEIAISSSETAIQFGIEPRIAMLSYSTGESGHGEDVDKVRKATEMVRERRPDLLVEGPLQYDAAVDPSVAATKMPDNPVAGKATVLVFPDLNTGNNLYKAVQRSANATAIGPVLQGLNKPVNDLSRGCTVTDIVNTVAITAIQAQKASS